VKISNNDKKLLSRGVRPLSDSKIINRARILYNELMKSAKEYNKVNKGEELTQQTRERLGVVVDELLFRIDKTIDNKRGDK